MSKVMTAVRFDENLEDVTIQWNTKYAMPVFVLSNGDKYVACTGEYAGYFQKLEYTDKLVQPNLQESEK